MITIVDYGMGNVGSVQNMLRRIGAEAELASAPDAVAAAHKLILPGVGAFDEGMRALNERGLTPALRAAVLDRSAPILGICLGMQLLTRRSDEGAAEGLGMLAGETLRLRPAPGPDGRALKVPHMGWNEVAVAKAHPLTAGMKPGERFYFVHSYAVACDRPDDVLLTAQYGGPVTAGFAAGPVMGVQFHPEKSHRFGMGLLQRFAEMA